MLASSTSSGATTSLFEIFGLLNYFLPFNLTLDAFCPIIYFHYSWSFSYIIFPELAWASVFFSGASFQFSRSCWRLSRKKRKFQYHTAGNVLINYWNVSVLPCQALTVSEMKASSKYPNVCEVTNFRAQSVSNVKCRVAEQSLIWMECMPLCRDSSVLLNVSLSN